MLTNTMPHVASVVLPEARILAAYGIFLASYVVFALGKFPGLKIDRTGAAIIGAVGMVAFRIVQPDQTLQFINFSTIVLLFSMMLIVGNLHLVGFFEWNAEAVLRRLKPKHLLPAVIFTCGVLSAFFVNDIVCLVMVPFVLSITRRMKLEPLPYLLAVATASNIGSVSTITGNPQNMEPSKGGAAPTARSVEKARTAVAGLRRCEVCGFPVSEGRKFCLDCERKKPAESVAAIATEVVHPVEAPQLPAESGTTEQPSAPAEKSVPQVAEAVPAAPQFLMNSSDQDESWIASHKYAVVAIAIVIVGLIVYLLSR